MALTFNKVDQLLKKGRFQPAEKILINEYENRPSPALIKRLLIIKQKFDPQNQLATPLRLTISEQIQSLDQAIAKNDKDYFIARYDKNMIGFLETPVDAIHVFLSSLDNAPLWLDYLISIRDPKTNTKKFLPDSLSQIFQDQVRNLFHQSRVNLSFEAIDNLTQLTTHTKFFCDLAESQENLWELTALLTRISLFVSDLKLVKTYLSATEKLYNQSASQKKDVSVNKDNGDFSSFFSLVQSSLEIRNTSSPIEFEMESLTQEPDLLQIAYPSSVLLSQNPFQHFRLSPFCKAADIHKALPQALQFNKKTSPHDLMRLRTALLTPNGLDHAKKIYFAVL